MRLATGTRLGPYEIVSALGAGGMGEVYRGRDTRLDRIVAIKVLPPQLAEQPELRERFEREARAVAALNHPHICALHDVGRQDGIDFLVMEYLEGETLAKRLAAGPLPMAEVLRYGIQIASALDDAHRNGVVHRDLKPGNVMLTKAGAKLLDFGLARVGVVGRGPAGTDPVLTALPTQADGLTQKGTILGTFQYMAPEQLEGKDADARSDIFAFGAVLYEMATGKKAFEARSGASLIGAILHTEPPPIASIQQATPPPLDRVVRRCLAKSPDDRWQTARDLMFELQWTADEGVGGRGPGVGDLKPRRPVAWMAATVVLLLVAIGLGIAWWRRPAEEVRALQFSVSPPPKTTLLPVIAGASVAVSPDGRRLVFAAGTPESPHQLWVRPLDSRVAQPLAGTDDATFPFWSPDSRFVGFFAGGKLKKIDLAGGPPQSLCDANVGRGGGAWGAGGVIVFSPGAGALQRVPASGGVPTPATQLDSTRQDMSHRWPSFLPDGRRFLFYTRSLKADDSGVYLGSLDSKEVRLLVRGPTGAAYAAPGGGSAGYLLFARDRTLMAQPFEVVRAQLEGEPFPVAEEVTSTFVAGPAFSVSSADVLVWRSEGPARSEIAWWDRDGKRLGAIGEPGAYGRTLLSPDETMAAVERDDPQSGLPDVWLADLSRQAFTRFTFSPVVDWFPVWSPNGKRILYASGSAGASTLVWKPTSGAGNEELLLKSPELVFATTWSADGRFVGYGLLSQKTRYDIWVLPLEGPEGAPGKPFPYLQTEFSEMRAQFSPDGRWIAYSSDETSRFEVYVQSFNGGPAGAGGGKWPVSINGGSLPRWRSDGKELFYVAGDRKLMAAEVKTDGATFRAGVPRALFETRMDIAIGARSSFAPSRDGRRFLISQPTEAVSTSPIHVSVNWAKR